ncbi:hypothetical protein [Phaffia rhodozyma]|uniref:Uncharacterized protein n=1 Tax=Phaffia rhodozyma TaxID=264483 RepID=A0A0F7SV86_PHARH|nr:hypothetical protein [Phaffia rhodozyma]
MSNSFKSYVGRTSSVGTSSKPTRKTPSRKTAEKDSFKSLIFEEDIETESVDHRKKNTFEKRKRKRREDAVVEEPDSFDESDKQMETDEEQGHTGEISEGVAGSQIDLVRLSEEFRARRANKSAVLRDSYTTKVVAPIINARQSVLSQWEKMDAQMAERMDCLRMTLAPTQLDVSIYSSLGAQRELASQTLCSAYERCTRQLVPEVLGLADDDLNSCKPTISPVLI